MDDNRTATALSGAPSAAADPESVPLALQVDTDETVASAELDVAEPVEYRDTNALLRQQYLQATAEMQAATASGDPQAAAAARSRREEIANEFIRRNTPLAARGASPFLIKDGDGRQDHMQAALLGMWEAFTGTDASKVDEVVLDENGVAQPAVGWDPRKGTYATLATRHIAGAVRRSVRSTEGNHAGISYNTFVQKPRVESARRALLEELERTPTNAEIAQRAGVTLETVQACLTARPVSLDQPTSTEGDGTLGDLLAASSPVLDEVGPEAESMLLAKVDALAGQDLLVLLMKTGLAGGEPLTVNRTADKLCIGRGATNLAIKRYQAALSTPVEELPQRPPQAVTCPCGESFVYAGDGEPPFEPRELDLPSQQGKTLSVWRAELDEWTRASNAAYEADVADHERARAEYWAAAHREARAFASAHAAHM